MPPKTIQNIRKKFKNQKKKKLAEVKKGKKKVKDKNKFVKTLKNLGADKSEDEKIRLFFATIEDVKENEIRDEFKNFSKGKLWPTQQTFKDILDNLPISLYDNFTKAYLSQDEKGLQQFWDTYKSVPLVALEIEKYRDYLQVNDDIADMFGDDDIDKRDINIEGVRLQKELEPILKKLVEDKKIEKGEKDGEGVEQKVIEYDPDGDIKVDGLRALPAEDYYMPSYLHVADPITNVIDKSCQNKRYNLSWIKANSVNNVYIRSANDDESILPYILEGTEREWNGNEWYVANDKYSRMMCNVYSNSRIQEGDTLSAINDEGKRVRFHVGYDTNKGFIEQDEKIFQDELDAMSKIKQSRYNKINKILAEVPTQEVDTIIARNLSKLLHKIAPDVVEYGDDENYNTPYIMQAVASMNRNSTTVYDQANQMANVAIFLDGTLDEFSNKIFAKRVAEEYYLPGVLTELSLSDKLPEVFNDPRVSKKARMDITKVIKKHISSYIKNVGLAIYELRDPTVQRRAFTESTKAAVNTSFDLKAWKSACVNKDDIGVDVGDGDVAYYKEDNKVYCLVISDVAKDLLFDDRPVNPVTKKPLSKKFIRHFKKIYDIKESDDSILVDEVDETGKEKVEEKKVELAILAPGLLDLIIQNIKGCEQEIKEDALGEDGRCSEEEPDDEETESEDEGDSDHGSDDDSGSDHGSDDDSDHGSDSDDDSGSDRNDSYYDDMPSLQDDLSLSISSDNASSRSDSVSSLDMDSDDDSVASTVVHSSAGSYKFPSTNNEKCLHCNKDLNSEEALKSQIEKDGSFSTVYFCKFPAKCFENHSDWPKKKKKKKKGNKGSKKGGRNSTKERNQ